MATGWPMKTTYANGDVYSAADVNDITGTINLLGSSVAYTAGKNKIINGDFNINQRNFSSTTTDGTYGFDRWVLAYSGGTCTYSTQAFTPGTAPVSGYESKSYARLVTASQSTAGHFAAVNQKIEDVRTFAGQSVTFSFWAKASTGTPNIGVALQQFFGSGGSPSAEVVTSTAVKTITSSWARYSFTISVPSISGKTIGTTANTSYLGAWIFTSCGTTISALGYPAVGVQNVTIDIWGVQLEQGSTATAFQTATGTIQGELAACQRYYYRMQSTTAGDSFFGTGLSNSTTGASILVTFPVTMRIRPTALEQTGTAADYRIRQATTTTACSAVPTYDSAENFTAFVNMTVASGLTAGQAIVGRSANTSSYLGWSAEL